MGLVVVEVFLTDDNNCWTKFEGSVFEVSVVASASPDIESVLELVSNLLLSNSSSKP